MVSKNAIRFEALRDLSHALRVDHVSRAVKMVSSITLAPFYRPIIHAP